MSKSTHPLTPVAARSGAVLTAFSFALLASITTFLILFSVVPAFYWSPRDHVELPFDLAALVRLIEMSHHAAAPTLALSGDASDRLGELAKYIGGWIMYPSEIGRAFWRTSTSIDMAIKLPIRLLGAALAGWVVAVPIYRQMLSRTPKLRSARWIDGPKTLWFGAAIGAARSHLAGFIAEFPDGVLLAPGLQLPRLAEHESVFAIGLPGSGKTVIAEGVARQAIMRGDHVLQLDVKGALHSRIAALIGRKHSAVVGMGRTSSVWAIGRDVRSPAAASRVAAIMIPESRDPVWSAASRLVFKGLLLKLIREHRQDWGWRELQAAISKPVEEIANDLRPTMRQVAEMLRGKGDDPTTMSLSVVFNMIAHVAEIVDTCAAMERDGRPRISLMDWARKRSCQRIIVLRHDLSNRDNSELLLTLMFRVLASELLSTAMADNVDHSVWIVADELPRFRGAMKDIMELASLGRSRGIRVVATAQSLAQIEDASTKAAAEALTENFATIVVCKARAGKNATELSESLMGMTTYGIDPPGKPGETELHKVPALSPHEMSTSLGLTVDWQGSKSIRASIVGFDNIYVVEWPLDTWRRL
ncbi:type IV secretion system DNA-binding domain-containing protein [Bradyrhizobium sp. ISRA442]|uniref:type IV secretion system DNA-binding domain-containing protein n=1 Tax=Bradyrhizobium sp. ISRA442 TaxID=2866197 RepID=UPI00311ACD09